MKYQEELSFWDNWFKDKGGEFSKAYNDRLNPDLEVGVDLKNLLRFYDVDENFRILDAGSGPVTSLGKKLNGKKLNITATDILGDEYREMYESHSYTPLVPVETCSFFDLSKVFGRESFDFVYSRNSLDHCDDPLKAIVELCLVCKKTGMVYLKNEVREATRANGQGLHKWDFYSLSGDLIVENYITKENTSLKDYILNSCETHLFSEIGVTETDGWVITTISR